MKQERKTVERSVKSKVGSLKRSNKINVSLVSLILKIRGKTQITNISNERGNIIRDSTHTERKVKEQYEQHVCKCDNSEEMGKFLQRHKLPNFT